MPGTGQPPPPVMAGEERCCASGVSAPLGGPSCAVDPRSTCGNPYRYAGGGVSAAIAKQLEKNRRRARGAWIDTLPNETLKHILPDLLSEGHVCSCHVSDVPILPTNVGYH